MLIKEIAEILEISGSLINPTAEITTLLYDSRRARGSSSELFIALEGNQRDGHQFIGQLYTLGIKNFLVSEHFDSSPFPEANFLKVGDTLAALQSIATFKRHQFKNPVIGITGSNGKTIVKEWLSTILEQEKSVLKSPKSYNSQLGVPISIWPLNADHAVAILEAGISKAGEMATIEKMIHPTIGIFTNIGEAHSEGFDSLNQKIEEKAKLFANSDLVICCASHSNIVESLTEQNIPLLSWGIDQKDAVINMSLIEDRIQFDYSGNHFEFTISLKNSQDLENMLHAVVAAVVLQISQQTIQTSLNKLKPIPMRLQLKRGQHDTYILDDSYNNDLLGLEVALDYLLQQPHKKKKTVILSNILQSGKGARQLYQEVNNLLQAHQIDRLIGVGKEINEYVNVFEMEFIGFPDTKNLLKDAPDFSNELILVKGARDFELERVVTYLEERNHGTVLEVNFEAITHNLNAYRNRLKSEVKLMVMVKAFAYGVGVEEIAHLLQYHKVDYLGVAYLDEAINLRKKGISLPIMIMNVDWDSFRLLETFELEPEIYSIAMLQKFLEDCPNPLPIHLKMETGMNRLGFVAEDLAPLKAILQANPQLQVASIFTHFSSADMSDEDAYTESQASVFNKMYEDIISVLNYEPIKHAANSAGIIRWPQFQFDMVRLGIGLYGFDITGQVNLKPISQLKTKISQIKTVKKGDSIGYSRIGRAPRDGQIATIAIGYADGYSRAFSNGNAYVMVNGQQAPTIGNVCMDMTMIDVTGLDTKEGDEVIVFGNSPSIVELSNWANTIPYEILTNVSQRVKRVFVSE